MAEYIYRIRPDLDTIKNIYDSNGVVEWDIYTYKNRLFAGDTLYIYFLEFVSQSQNEKSILCKTMCISYIGTVEKILEEKNYKVNSSVKTVKITLQLVSADSSDRLNYEVLKQFGYKAGRMSLLSLDKNQALSDYIKGVLNNPTDKIEISPVPQTYEDLIINEYNIMSQLLEGDITKRNKKRSSGKPNGSLAANIFIKYIQSVLDNKNKPYRVSEQNAYIIGCSVEFDALIVDKDAYNIMGYNIYDPKNVVALIEFKAGGLIGEVDKFDCKANPESYFLKSLFDSYQKLLRYRKKPLKTGYITFREQIPKSTKAINYLDKTENLFETKAKLLGIKEDDYSLFCFTKSNNGHKFHGNKANWEDFVLSLLP